MAIIKTLLLQDTLGLGLRRNIVWSLLLVLGCIDYALAASPTSTEISVASAKDTGNGLTALVDGTLYRFTKDQDDVTLTCGHTGGSVHATLGYRFNKDTTPGDWQQAETKVLTLDEAACGVYTCEARETTSETTGTLSPAKTLTLICSSDGDQCGTDAKVTCDLTANKEHCKCIFDGVYPAAGCNACAAKKDCPEATPRCDTTPTPNVCAACDATTCDKDSKKPKCDTAGNPGPCLECDEAFCKATFPIAKPVCAKDATNQGKCVAKPATQASPATGSSGGTTGKADTTSSAGTVTSTACLVIASVVVALMN